jgi:hypothetical protein
VGGQENAMMVDKTRAALENLKKKLTEANTKSLPKIANTAEADNIGELIKQFRGEQKVRECRDKSHETTRRISE